MKTLLSALLVIVIAVVLIVSAVDALLPGSVDLFCLVEKDDFWTSNSPKCAEKSERSATTALLSLLDATNSNQFLDR